MDGAEWVAIVTAIGGSGAVVGALLNGLAAKHGRDRQNRSDAISEWKQIVDRLEAEHIASTQMLSTRIASLEARERECTNALMEARLVAAANEQRMRDMEAQIKMLGGGA